MATDTLQSGFTQAMNLEHGLPRAPAAARILAQFDRPTLEGFIAVAIGVLDAIDGDPDVELNGDERDFSVAGWAPGRHGAADEDVEDDDPAEEDDDSGGNVEDDGEPDHDAEREEGITPPAGTYGIDQRSMNTRFWIL